MNERFEYFSAGETVFAYRQSDGALFRLRIRGTLRRVDEPTEYEWIPVPKPPPREDVVTFNPGR